MSKKELQELIGKIKQYEKYGETDFDNGFDQALDEIIELLKSLVEN